MTAYNCTLSAAASLKLGPRVPALSALRPLKQKFQPEPIPFGLASLQPCARGSYRARLQSRLETKSLATEGARLRLKTYVRRNSPESRNVFQESCSSYESLKSKPIATPIRAAFRVSFSAFSGPFLPWSAGSTCLEHVQKDSAQWRRIRTTSPNCTLSAAASLRSVLGFPRSRHYGR